ncbi:MAG: lytic transglycosylase domain-containing protein [Actinomycetota bacterium]
MSRRRFGATFVALALVAGACQQSDVAGDAAPASTSTPTTSAGSSTSTTTTPSTTTTTPEPAEHPAAPNGRRYPAVPDTGAAVAARLVEVEQLLQTTDRTDADYPDLAHEQQLLYRHIGRNPDWILTLWDAVPDDLFATVERHVTARQSIGGIPSGDPPRNVPAWEIIEPLPADELLDLYRIASDATGIDWAYLAAINLIETGFGRIDGVSTANAQGPMQFLPTTWEEVSDGDIRDPYDAIPAAARYLVRRGGPDNMQRALWGYNNSDSYVAAVSAYADLFRADLANYYAAHQWEIHYSAAAGDLWFPVGYREDEIIPATDYLATAPWSAPPPPSTP